MKTYKFSSKSTSEGFQRSTDISVSPRQRVAPTLYRADKPFIPHETHGIIIPVELASSHLRVYVHISTTDLPDEATVGIEVRALDGSVNFTSKFSPVAPPQTLRIEVPQEELKHFSGKALAVRYKVQLPDEEPVDSEEVLAKVTSPIAYTPPVVEGLIGSMLKVSDYPDGLNVDEAIIENLEAPSVVLCHWVVFIRFENGEVTPLCDLMWQAPASPGSPYRFRIPAQAYIGFPAEAICNCVVAVDFAPHDSEAQTYGVGGHEFGLIQ